MNWKNDKLKQKYKCKKCNYCFIIKDRRNDKIRTEKLFNERIKEWYSIRQLSKQTWKKEDIIWENIKLELDSNLIYQIDIVFENVKYIMIDWTRISNEICLIIYYDYINRKVVRFWFYDWEKYEYIKNDLLVLRNEFKYEIACFIADWGKQIKKAIENIFPNAKMQRCLTHIQRQVKNYISNNPKHNCGKELQKIITFENFENKELLLLSSLKKALQIWSAFLKTR